MRCANWQRAGGWLEADTMGATHCNVIKAANKNQQAWANPGNCFSQQELRRNPAKTRNLLSTEVSLLASQSWREALPDEEQGPPCARCDKDHTSQDCPSFKHQRGHFISETFNVRTLDAAYAQIARDLHRVATADDPDILGQQKHMPWPHYIISNNKKGGDGTGEHWFTVAYSIRRR